MHKLTIPPFCQPCITQLQAACLHRHSSMMGNWHFSGGEVWDDLVEMCDECGANLDQLALLTIPEQSIPSPYLTLE